MKKRSYLEQTWREPRQRFRASAIQGIGAFAGAEISAGEVVEIVGGVVMSSAELHLFGLEHGGYNAIQITEESHLVELPEIRAEREGGLLNHSCDSNLWLADEVTLVARRPIAVNEELTVDYALFTSDPNWSLGPCRCGVAFCRHIVTGDDWRLEGVQERYFPHFSPFLNTRIAALRRSHGE